MNYGIEIKETAREDAVEAFLYYEGRQPGVGNRFLDKMELLLSDIEKHPKHYQEKYKQFRQALIKPFPYLIVFEIDAKIIVVHKVINAARHPRKRYKS
jgi:transcription antitermination factor NusA-like protein